MRKWSHIFDRSHFNTYILHSPDSRLTSSTWAFYKHFSLSQSSFVSYFTAIGSSHLGSIRSIFLRPFESHFTSRSPGDHLAVDVGNRDNNIVERSFDVYLTNRLHHNHALLGFIFSFLSHCRLII